MHTHRHGSRTTFYFLISRWQDNETQSSLDSKGNAVYRLVSDQGGTAVSVPRRRQATNGNDTSRLSAGTPDEGAADFLGATGRDASERWTATSMPGDAQGTRKNMQRIPNQLYILRVKCR